MNRIHYILPILVISIFFSLSSLAQDKNAKADNPPKKSNCVGAEMRSLVVTLLPKSHKQIRQSDIDSLLHLYELRNEGPICEGDFFGEINGDFEMRDSLLAKWRLWGLKDNKFLVFFMRLSDSRDLEFADWLPSYRFFFALYNPKGLRSVWKQLDYGRRNWFIHDITEGEYVSKVGNWLESDYGLKLKSYYWDALDIMPFQSLPEGADSSKVAFLDTVAVKNLWHMKKLGKELLELEKSWER